MGQQEQKLELLEEDVRKRIEQVNTKLMETVQRKTKIIRESLHKNDKQIDLLKNNTQTFEKDLNNKLQVQLEEKLKEINLKIGAQTGGLNQSTSMFSTSNLTTFKDLGSEIIKFNNGLERYPMSSLERIKMYLSKE